MVADPFSFVAVDVETANADVSTICQIGLARFEHGQLIDEWSTLVNPEDDFDAMNIMVHGIEAHHVIDAPTFGTITSHLERWCTGQIVVSHTPFDRTSIHRAFLRCNRPLPVMRWLDSARVVRRAWAQFAHRGYGLTNVCRTLGYTYTAHDALEDAKACGFVLARAIEETGLSLGDWLRRVERPLRAGADPGKPEPLSKLSGNPDGPLRGETIVFTGQIRIPRREAAQIAASLGADVPTSVNRKTTILVVGDQDIRRLAGQAKSAKHLKAEEQIRKGAELRILRESDFLALLEQFRS